MTNVNGEPAAGTPEPTPAADRDWFGGRRWTGVGALGVLIVVALCTGLLIFTRGGHKPHSVPPSASSPAPAGTASTDQQIPTAPPPDVTWSLYQSVALPQSPTAGPRTVSGDAAVGYAHTPTGALIAAAQISTRSLLALDTDWREALNAMVAPGVGRDAWAAQRSKISHATPDVPGTYSQIAGFNFLSFSRDDVVIQLATRASAGTLQQVPLHLTWLNGDWKQVFAPDGGDASNAQPLTDLNGFVPWSGV